MNRSARMTMAQQTVRLVEQGCYALPDGRNVEIAPLVASCLGATRFCPPEELDEMRQAGFDRTPEGPEAVVEVRNESTLAGIGRLLADGGGAVAALNFASAKNPGGGFLSGSQAQEESCATSKTRDYFTPRDSSSCSAG